MVEMGQHATALENPADADTRRGTPPGRDPARRDPARSAIPAAERQAILVRTVKLDVIPRLLSLVRSSDLERNLEAGAAPAANPAITPAHVLELANLALHGHDRAASAFVLDLRERGIPAETLLLELLTPVARLLGEWWEQDVCSFLEVTTGLWRLQEAMYGISPAFLAKASVPAGPRILLVPLPGEQHTFGLSMVFEFFRQAGWNAWSGPVASRAELAAAVSREWVDVVGFSLGSDERLEEARAEIEAVRVASRNPGLFVVVGGPAFGASAGLAASIGADGTAVDGAQAVAMAAELLERSGRRVRRG